MVLFLVMALLAAYANRSLMFEQRIAGSYYRSNMAQEMAEGGLDWAVAMLNGTAIDSSCAAVATGGTRWVDRNLNVSADDRGIKTKWTSAVRVDADCASTGDTLTCRCATPNTPRTAQPSTPSSILVPSFAIILGTGTDSSYGNFQVNSVGCTDSSVDNCIGVAKMQAMSQKATGVTRLLGQVGFVPAVPSSPTAPLTVKGTLTTAGVGGLGLHNTDPLSTGTLVVSGGDPPALNDARMDSVPGTPPQQASFFRDSYLASLGSTDEGKARFFRTFMGMAPGRYQNHPAARVVACPNTGGCETALQSAAAAGKRMMLVKGPLNISADTTIGSVAAPVVIVVYGAATITGPMQLNGMLVVLGDLDWSNTASGTSQITGMVVVQGDMRTNGRMDIIYRQSIATELRNRLGSYARVQGGTIDSDSN
jgi:hypothetical protein